MTRGIVDLDFSKLERSHLEMVTETFASRINELERVGQWKILDGSSGVGDENVVQLSQLKSLYPSLLELATSNPWHIRGAQLRHSYIFGKKFDIQDVGPTSVAQRVMDKPQNRDALFSTDALETNNLSLFTAGTLVILYNESAQEFTRVPIMEVSAISTDPDDNASIWYIQRTWNSLNEKGEEVLRKEWYPTADYKSSRKGMRKSFTEGAETIPVVDRTVAFLKHSKRPEGSPWGVPDSLGAVVYTLAYSEYLSDNAKLVKSLSRFAWNLTRPDKSAVKRTASQVHDAPGGVGSTAISAGGGVSSVGVPSAQVNMNNGQPLAAAVAASLGVPVIALLSSPGATGGSYGAASTLDQPTVKGFEVLQDSWAEFYEKILRYLGAKNAKVIFPPIQTDPPHRVMAALGVAVVQGLVWREDAADFAYNVLGIRRTKKGLPPDPGAVPDTDPMKPGARSVPGGVNHGDTDHSLDSENEPV